MPINRKGGSKSHSRAARVADALIEQPDPETGKTKGGPFGKRDQIVVTLARGGLKRAITIAAAERIAQGKNAGSDKPIRRGR